MNKLIRAVITEDFVGANQLFEDAMNELKEAKLFEVKRSLGEAEGKGEFKGQYYNDADDWARYRKAHPAVHPNKDSQGHHYPMGKKETKNGGGLTKYGLLNRKWKKGYVKASHYYAASKYMDILKNLVDKRERELDGVNQPKKKKTKNKNMPDALSEKYDMPPISGSVPSAKPKVDVVKGMSQAGAGTFKKKVKPVPVSTAVGSLDIKTKELAKKASTVASKEYGKTGSSEIQKPGSDIVNKMSQSSSNKAGDTNLIKKMAPSPKHTNVAVKMGQTFNSRLQKKRSERVADIAKHYAKRAATTGSVNSAKRAVKFAAQTPTGRTATTIAKGVVGAGRAFNNYMAGTLGENVGFNISGNPRKKKILRKRMKIRKNKYHIPGSEKSKIQTSTSTGIGL